MTSLPCDIAIIPNDELLQKAIKFSAQLRSYGTLFTLKNDSYFPHISLYMTQIKTDNMETINRLLRDIAAKVAPINLIAYRYFQPRGYIDAEYKRTESLDTLQELVVEAINPVRDGRLKNDEANLLDATGQARDNLKKYGYRFVGELFRPHLTFTRFQNGQSIDVIN